jgi:hypothetical protein
MPRLISCAWCNRHLLTRQPARRYHQECAVQAAKAKRNQADRARRRKAAELAAELPPGYGHCLDCGDMTELYCSECREEHRLPRVADSFAAAIDIPDTLDDSDEFGT